MAKIKVTQVKSSIKRMQSQKKNFGSIGFKRDWKRGYPRGNSQYSWNDRQSKTFG